jgi:hypothetical protein
MRRRNATMVICLVAAVGLGAFGYSYIFDRWRGDPYYEFTDDEMRTFSLKVLDAEGLPWGITSSAMSQGELDQATMGAKRIRDFAESRPNGRLKAYLQEWASYYEDEVGEASRDFAKRVKVDRALGGYKNSRP